MRRAGARHLDGEAVAALAARALRRGGEPRARLEPQRAADLVTFGSCRCSVDPKEGWNGAIRSFMHGASVRIGPEAEPTLTDVTIAGPLDFSEILDLHRLTTHSEGGPSPRARLRTITGGALRSEHLTKALAAKTLERLDVDLLQEAFTTRRDRRRRDPEAQGRRRKHEATQRP